MIARHLCLSLALALAGCQTPGLERTPATSRYLQRDLTVAWSERHYWQPPLARPGAESWPSQPAPAATRPPPPAGEVARQPAALPWPAAALACRQGSC